MRIRNSTKVLLALILSAAPMLAQTSSPGPTKLPAGAGVGASTGVSEGIKSIATDGAPKAVGPYSQAIVAGGFLFAAGQIPLDPKTGELVTGGIDAAAERVMNNLEAVLKAEGLGFANVVKTTVFLARAEDFAAFNAVYGRRMGSSRPARSTVFVAGLPRNAPLEIELVARAR